MKRLNLLGATIALTSVFTMNAAADVVCRGQVLDEQGEPCIGAVIMIPGTKIGTNADAEGYFQLTVPDKTKELQITYVGYKPAKVAVRKDMGEVKLETDTKTLQDVVITQSVARTRKTPVALSQVDALTIEAKLGNQEFPEVLKTTPGVWATPDGGGFGDAKINMRGFKSENVAVLINGVPVNDMEWGGIYWSNWAGLSDVTSSMQTQRGLGAAVVSAPSVGGTINIVTKNIDAKRGGRAWYGVGNDMMNTFGFTVSTGLMKNGWAITVLGSRKWGDGYVEGTNYNAWNYFVNVAKKIGENHQLSLTAFGAPQSHYQRSNQNGLTIEGWQNVRNYMNGKSPYKYNPTVGYDRHGQFRNSNYNFYHKPQISLNHIWQIDYKSSLSSVAYVSFSRGGGYSGQGHGTYNGTALSNTSWYGASQGILSTTFRCPDGTFDYAAIQEMNAASTTGSNMVMSSSNNDHEWYGLMSTYKNEFIPKTLTFTGGLDLRYYVGHHNNKIVDLYDGEYYMNFESRKNVRPQNNAAALNPDWKFEHLGVGDVVYRDYDGYTAQEGVFAQAEYTGLDDRLTAVIAGTLNNTSYWRRDHFYYDKEHERSETQNFFGGTIKGGVNYNINEHNNVFVNGGFISRAPFFSYGVFLSSATNNAVNPEAKNSKIGSVELGYGYHSRPFSLSLNLYWTKWLDKCDRSTVRSGEITSGPNAGQYFSLALDGVNARHMGAEVNFTWIPLRWLQVEGMLSWGDWQWDSNPTGYFYNDQGQPISDLRGTLASGILAPDHAKATVMQKGRKIGGSAQTTGFLGVTFRPFKGFRIGADWVCSARNYSDYEISSSSYDANKTVTVADPWKIPFGNELDLSASYNFQIGKVGATLIGNVNNVFNNYYVKDAYTSSSTDGAWDNAYRVFYSFGRTFSIKLKINF